MKQHTKPCSTCPFRRDSTPGELGGSPVETFIGQTFGAFWIPCHECIDYSDPNWREQYEKGQCAGTAIYRANCHPANRPPELLKLPADTELVFSTPAEFMAHHLRITVDEAARRLKECHPVNHWLREMRDARARVIEQGILPNQHGGSTKESE